jgi:hypothetical protein
MSVGLLIAAPVLLLLSCCAMSTDAAMATAGPNTPGWTGRTIVRGSNSTIAGDAQATYDQQKWPFGERP